ncbi:hypothetical protein Tco_1343418 [Tanacetum coccineum]
MAESAKRHEENSNIIKEIRASTDAAIRNQRASIKTLEIQIKKMSKVLQERWCGSLPSSTETNPRDQVKSISTADFSGICRIGCGPYAVSGTQHRSILSETVPFPGRLLNFSCDDWREAQDVKILDAYDHTLPQKEEDPVSFTLPYFIRNICFDKALLDLGASVSIMPFSTYKDKDERESHAGTLIDIPVFVGSFSIISGFTIIDNDDMTKDVDLAENYDIVTYTSISSDSNGPSWGIPLVNASELPKMDPYEEVEDQPYANDASSTAKSPGYIADSESMEEDSIDYPNEPEDGDEDPEEDPEEDHTPADREDGDDEPSDDDNDNDDINDEDEEPNEDEEEEEHIASTDSFALPVVDPIPLVGDTKAFETDEAWKTVKLEPHMSAFMEARIVEHDVAPIPPTSSAYDQASLAESSAAFAAIPPRGQYDFVDTIEAGQGLIRSPGHDGWTIARVADIVEDVGYVRALQASKRRMMTSIKEVNLRVSYQA